MDPVTSQPVPTAGAAPSISSNSAISSDFETFLTMLTVQIENQDPLNPVDATDFATQLATFSSVEQQVLTNDLLQDVKGILNGNTLQQMGDWVGKQALTKSPAFYDGQPIEMNLDFAHGADTAYLTVRDSSGALVNREAVSVNDTTYAWDGKDTLGLEVPVAQYTFAIENYAGDTTLDQTIPATYGRIEEVRSVNGSYVLFLNGGAEVSPDEVLGLRSDQE